MTKEKRYLYLNTSCHTEDDHCKFCYSGEVNCLGQPKPYGTLIMGGASNSEQFVGSVEVFVKGQGPYLNVMHVSLFDVFSPEAGFEPSFLGL